MALTLAYVRYVWHQVRQSYAKRRKDPTFRVAPAVDNIIAATALPYASNILCIGSRNRLEPDLWRRRGYHRVTAVDLLPSPGVRVADMHGLPFHDHTRDLVFASHVLEHALDPCLALQEIIRVLRPGGYLYAAFPVGFTPNAHDRVDFGDADGFLARLPPTCRSRVLWTRRRGDEVSLLLQIV